MTFARLVAIVAIAWLSVAPSGAADRRAPVVRVDHHVHLHAPAILAILPDYCASPGRASKCDADFTRPLAVADLRRAMDDAGIRRAQVMSTAYLAESPLMTALPPNHAAIVRAANDFTVGLARAQPARFSAYIGVNPLTPTALPEIAHWRGDRHVAGIKLHLANSRFDYHRPEQVRMLAGVVRAAASARWRIMIHMRHRAEGYGADEARIFVSKVLPAARGTTVQIAHLAGWGGVDSATLAALGVFAETCEHDRPRCANLYFDLAAIRPESVPDRDKAALVGLMRRIGLRHFVPASDWPFMRDLRAYYAGLRMLPLSDTEWRKVARNVVR
ncbi:amidohydrolase family protein [Sphingomonas lycopersici]|uniref:Amidohydrolase n=1 Tax=Sphingomonas lycopersici TaxID=2951807 RepID=A0AA41ZBR6_9SPHN|nr:amidohydrolase [Sphingomonas lycopersici]